nr:hypothetical protein [Tanacetum cinerariifolium]
MPLIDGVFDNKSKEEKKEKRKVEGDTTCGRLIGFLFIQKSVCVMTQAKQRSTWRKSSSKGVPSLGSRTPLSSQLAEALLCTQDWIRRKRMEINMDEIEDLLNDDEVVKKLEETGLRNILCLSSSSDPKNIWRLKLLEREDRKMGLLCIGGFFYGSLVSFRWHSTMPKTKTNSSAYRSMLEKHQLTGPNFNEWFRALKLVVRTEKLHDVFETALSHAPAAGANAQALVDWAVLFYRHNEVACLMIKNMSSKLYQQFEHNSPLEMTERQSVSDHVLLIKSYLDQLATLNYAFPDKVFISFILNSLSSEFKAFMQNYNMQSMQKTISEVHSLLIEFEKSIKRNKQPIVGASSTPQVMAIQGGRVQKYKSQGKAKGKGKGKGKGPQNSYPTKPKTPQPYKKERSEKDRQCHQCKEEGHWKRNCPMYLAELMKKKKKTRGQNAASTSSGLGCEAHVKRHAPDKLQQRSVKCIFVGYPKETMGYYFYYPPENKIVVERYADFLEKDFILQKESGIIVKLEDEDILPSENTSEHPIEKEVLPQLSLKKRMLFPFVDLKHFSPVADIRAIRILIAISAYYDYDIWKMDVTTAFLNDFLGEEIYMEQPEGFIDPSHHKKVCKLQKSIYGLKQASRSRNKRFGSIIYAVRCTRPDVAFEQNITRRFQHNSGQAHWADVKNILKYLRNTKDTFLVYGGDPKAELRVNCYCDAGFETGRDYTKSQTGYVFILNGGSVIRKFIDELGVVPSNDYPIKMNCDNSGAIIMAKESGIQKGARHFKRKYHYTHECIETSEIDIVKVHTDDNLADPFTKALAGPKLTRHARSMCLRPASSFILTSCNGKVYALSTISSYSTFVIHVDIVVKDKEVLINLMLFCACPLPSSGRGGFGMIHYLKGSSTELFYINIVFDVKIKRTENTPVDVFIYKSDMTSIDWEKTKCLNERDITDLDMSVEIWEEMDDLKDTNFFVDLGRDHLASYSHVIAAELGGFIHILGEMGDIIYSYHVNDNTISLLHTPSPMLPSSHVSLWEYRFEDDHGETKCIDSKVEMENNDVILSKPVKHNGVESSESHLLNIL